MMGRQSSVGDSRGKSQSAVAIGGWSPISATISSRSLPMRHWSLRPPCFTGATCPSKGSSQSSHLPKGVETPMGPRHTRLPRSRTSSARSRRMRSGLSSRCPRLPPIRRAASRRTASAEASAVRACAARLDGARGGLMEIRVGLMLRRSAERGVPTQPMRAGGGLYPRPRWAPGPERIGISKSLRLEASPRDAEVS